ncbi:MAG TPA: hypothetical protein VLA04_04545 [Verrucomicrobiae bacterium]|nr:hypothetical protein [Verrucomicrobiae bacterium]
MYGSVLRTVIFPLVTLTTKRKFWRSYKKVRSTERLSAAQLEEMQWQKLQKLLVHSYEHVPYYRSLFEKAGITPADITSPKDLAKLPVTTKADLRAAGLEATSADNHKEFGSYMDSTSGSTGQPFQFRGDVEARDLSTAYTLRSWNWGGYAVGHPYVSLWGFHKQDTSNKLFNRLMRNTYLSAFDLDDSFDDFIAIIRQRKPMLITAYTASMVKFAKMIKDRGITDITIPVVIPTSENLYDHHRALIEEAVHGKVYDRYGSRELGAVASECSEQDGLHINMESFIVEYLPEKETKSNRLIITHLDKYSMPLIRYDTGDLGKPGPKKVCPCGLAHQKIAAIDGRVTDFITLKDGSTVPYLFFNYSLEQYGSKIRQFQISQPSVEKIVVKVVATKEFSKSEQKELATLLEKGMRNMCVVEVKPVEKISLAKSGKFQIVDKKVS